jgi:hypothetical protein
LVKVAGIARVTDLLLLALAKAAEATELIGVKLQTYLPWKTLAIDGAFVGY